MTHSRASLWIALPVLFWGLLASASSIPAADLGPEPRRSLAEPLPSDSRWQLEFRLYAWVLFLAGESRLGANSADIDTNLFQIINKADELYPFMSYQEARKGRFGLILDLFWSKINVGTSTIRSANPIAGLTANLVANADVWQDVAIIESGVAYEFGRWGPRVSSLKDTPPSTSTTALDMVAGVRYWYMKSDIDLSVTGTVNIPALGLTRTGAGAISAKKVVDWWDPFVGLRVRHKPAPGQELMLRGDVGGFGAGSDITVQLAAGYSMDTQLFGMPTTAYFGYRALYIDYEQGNGNRTFGLDMWWHGPVLGATFRW